MEYKFTFTVYDLDPETAAKLREQLQEVILVEVESQNIFVGPLVEEEVTDGEGQTAE